MSSNYENLQANVLRILEPAKLGDRTSKIWDLSLFGLVVLNLIAVALESVPTLQNNYGSWFYNFEIFSVGVFITLISIVFWAIEGPGGYHLHPEEDKTDS